MRWETSLALVWCAGLSACGFEVTAGDDMTIPPGLQKELVDDTAAELGDHAALTDGTVAARGAIEPDAFIRGAWHARAWRYDGVQVITAATDLETVFTGLGPPKGEAYNFIPAVWSDLAGRPRGLGLEGGDDFVLAFDGEIELPAGTIELALAADDHAVVQLMLDGSTWSTNLFDDTTVAAKRTFQVPARGWYPIRGAYAEDFGIAGLQLDITPASGAPFHVDQNQLRSRVTTATGLQVQAYARRGLVAPVGQTWVPTVDVDFGSATPKYDAPISFDGFSLRYTGQLEIREPADYVFSADIGNDANDLFRIWVDGIIVAQKYGATAPSGTITLAPGWHDLTVDYSDDVGNAKITVSVTGADLNGPVPTTRLRPVQAFGLTTGAEGAGFPGLVDATPAAPGIKDIPLALEIPPGAPTVAAADWIFDVEGQSNIADLTAAMVGCAIAAPEVALLGNGNGGKFADTTCKGQPLQAAWTYRITDSVVGGSVGYVRDMQMVVTYAGGDELVPYAPVTIYESSPKATPGAIGFGKVVVDASLGSSTLTIEVRTGDAESIATAPWVAVASGSVPQIDAQDLVQYKLTVAQDGWQRVSIDRVSITYVVP